MIKSITVTNYLGDSIKLELARPEESGFIVTSVTGLGAGKANINMTEVATNNGGLFNSSRLPSRTVSKDLELRIEPLRAAARTVNSFFRFNKASTKAFPI